MKDIESSTAALYDGGWRAEDREEMIFCYDMDENEADAVCELLKTFEEA